MLLIVHGQQVEIRTNVRRCTLLQMLETQPIFILLTWSGLLLSTVNVVVWRDKKDLVDEISTCVAHVPCDITQTYSHGARSHSSPQIDSKA